MPKAYLRYYEVERENLPPVCMRCGEPSTNYRNKKFQWHPPWVAITILAGLLVYVILALILTKRMTVSVPLCDRHRYHWAKRTAFIVIGLLALVGGVFVCAILSGEMRNSDMVPVLWLTLLGLFLLWLVGTITAALTMIRPTEITENAIELKGVSDRFIDAVDQQRQEDGVRRAERPRERGYDDRGRERDDEDRDRPRPRRDDDRFREEPRRDREDDY